MHQIWSHEAPFFVLTKYCIIHSLSTLCSDTLLLLSHSCVWADYLFNHHHQLHTWPHHKWVDVKASCSRALLHYPLVRTGIKSPTSCFETIIYHLHHLSFILLLQCEFGQKLFGSFYTHNFKIYSWILFISWLFWSDHLVLIA